MRNLTFTRKKNINGCIVPYRIEIDGRVRGEVENGKTEIIPIDTNSHTVRICAPLGDRDWWSNTVEVYQGNSNCSFEIVTKTGLLRVNVFLNRV